MPKSDIPHCAQRVDVESVAIVRELAARSGETHTHGDMQTR